MNSLLELDSRPCVAVGSTGFHDVHHGDDAFFFVKLTVDKLVRISPHFSVHKNPSVDSAMNQMHPV